VFIPIRPGSSVFDVMERRPSIQPPIGLGVNRQPSSALSAGALELPTGKDVSRELDVLFTRLAARAAEQRAEARVDREGSSPGTRSTLTSSRPMTGEPLAYASVKLSLAGSSSQATLSGSYSGVGAASASALRVEISQAASVGSNPSALKFTVSNQDGGVLFSYDGLAKAGQPISLGADIGLQIAFSAGALQARSATEVPVTALQPYKVDINASFDDPDQRPRFDGGARVTAGSFLVNGSRIEVRADDSIASVLQRISENVPDIKASFDDDRIRLTSQLSSRRPIVVGDDSSGFLAATRLAGGLSVPGGAAGGDERLSLMAQFARVQAGRFRLGGNWVAVDPASDSVNSVMARMREAAPHVLAYLDGDQRLVVRGDEGEAALGDDSSGFLAAMGLDGGKPLPLRERLQLDAGTSQRVQLQNSSRKAQVMRELLDYLGVSASATEGVESARAQADQSAGAARAAKLAYAREDGRSAVGRDTATPI
jgi:hypothetical protein